VIEVTTVGDPDNNEISLFLSPDMQPSLKSAMNGSYARIVNTGCYQAVIYVLKDTNRILESRSLNKGVPEKRQAPFIAAGCDVVAGLLFPLLYEGDHTAPVPIKILPNKLRVLLS
jgi:hypothetical protein